MLIHQYIKEKIPHIKYGVNQHHKDFLKENKDPVFILEGDFIRLKNINYKHFASLIKSSNKSFIEQIVSAHQFYFNLLENINTEIFNASFHVNIFRPKFIDLSDIKTLHFEKVRKRTLINPSHLRFQNSNKCIYFDFDGYTRIPNIYKSNRYDTEYYNINMKYCNYQNILEFLNKLKSNANNIKS